MILMMALGVEGCIPCWRLINFPRFIIVDPFYVLVVGYFMINRLYQGVPAEAFAA
jgi:hypothetical protein